jgi:hypothetical protein
MPSPVNLSYRGSFFNNEFSPRAYSPAVDFRIENLEVSSGQWYYYYLTFD